MTMAKSICSSVIYGTNKKYDINSRVGLTPRHSFLSNNISSPVSFLSNNISSLEGIASFLIILVGLVLLG